MNDNFRELARFIEGRTGSMDAGVSTQDLFQRSTAVLYADDGSLNVGAGSIEMGNATASGVVAQGTSGDGLLIGAGFTGGTAISGNATVANNLSVGGALNSTGTELRVNSYFITTAGLSVHNTRPYFDQGLAHRNCYDRYGGFNGSNQFSFGECDNGHYMVGIQCRDNGVNSLQCMARCCAP